MTDSGSFTQIILLTSQFIAMKLKSLFTIFFNLSLVTLTGQLERNTIGNVKTVKLRIRVKI